VPALPVNSSDQISGPKVKLGKIIFALLGLVMIGVAMFGPTIFQIFFFETTVH
jgi:hypothetical protein